MDYAVDVRGLTKTYRRRKDEPVVACRDVSFSIEPGTVAGLLGPNGAGKTTIVKCILGLLRPSEGTVLVHGVNGWTQSAQAKRVVSAVLEGSRNIYWRLTVMENIEFFARLHGRHGPGIIHGAKELIGFLGLEDKATAPVRTLSRGMQQKVAIACALIKNTPVLLLDEPTLGLDVEASRTLRFSLRDIARREGRTILVSGHDMRLVEEVCDRVLVVSRGRLVADDSVDRLLSLFRARAVVVRLASEPGPELVERLREVSGYVRCGDGTAPHLKMTFTNREDIYKIMDILREGGAEIERLDTETPDMEETYLRLVKGGAGSGASEPA